MSDGDDSTFDEAAFFEAAMRRFDAAVDADLNDDATIALEPISLPRQTADDDDDDDDFDFEQQEQQQPEEEEEEVSTAAHRGDDDDDDEDDGDSSLTDVDKVPGTADLDELEAFLDDIIIMRRMQAMQQQILDENRALEQRRSASEAAAASSSAEKFDPPALPPPPRAAPVSSSLPRDSADFEPPSMPPPPRTPPPSTLQRPPSAPPTAVDSPAPPTASGTTQRRGVSKAARFGDRPELCQLCNSSKAKAVVKRKGIAIWMCKPCANETNDTFAQAGTVGIDTLAVVAALDPSGAAPLPVPPEWTGTIDMRRLPTLPAVPAAAPPPLPEQEPASDSDDEPAPDGPAPDPEPEDAAPEEPLDKAPQAAVPEPVEPEHVTDSQPASQPPVELEAAKSAAADDAPPSPEPVIHSQATPQPPVEPEAAKPAAADSDAPPPFVDLSAQPAVAAKPAAAADDAPPPFDDTHAAPPQKCSICSKRAAKHRATTKAGQQVLLCVKCVATIRRKKDLVPQAKAAPAVTTAAAAVAATAAATLSLSNSTKADLQAMAKATAVGDMTLKRVKTRLCQRCTRPGVLLKANLGARLVILCAGCVEDVRAHLSARERRVDGDAAALPKAAAAAAAAPGSKIVSRGSGHNLCERCNTAEATRSVQTTDGSAGAPRFCAPCATKLTLKSGRNAQR